MPHELRATRYVSSTNEHLVPFISNDLHRLSYEEAMRFYARSMAQDSTGALKLDHLGRALLGANDRFFLLGMILRRKDIFHPWLYARCREVEANPDGYLDLWARYHYKSTIITFAGSIQDMIIDPEITICILSNVKSLAHAFLGQIKVELEENVILKTLYSDVFWQHPKKEARRWGLDSGLEIKRRQNPKEATIEGWGLIDGQPTGFHYDRLVYDDIVTDRQATNPVQVRKTTLAWEASDNLGKPSGTGKRTVGTRWSFADTYGQIVDDGRIIARKHPATKDGTLKGEPVFLSRQRWAEVKKAQKSTVSAQMLLNPIAGSEAVFQSTWFRPYDVYPSIMNVYILVDPSKGKKKHANDQRPDRTAIAVVGIDPADNKYLLDGYCHRMRLSERYVHIRDLRSKWSAYRGVQIVKVGYERYGAQVDTEVIEDMQDIDGERFEIIELSTPREGEHSKNARIERLEPDLRDGRFFLPAVVYNPDMWTEADRRAWIDRTRQGFGMCQWSVWTAEDDVAWLERTRGDMREERRANPDAPDPEVEPPLSPHDIGKVLYRPLRGLTRQQRFHDTAGQRHRIVKAVRRTDEDNDYYDLTRVIMDELRQHPFAPHDDLIDAVSRLYDIDPTAPQQTESRVEDDFDEDLPVERYDA